MASSVMPDARLLMPSTQGGFMYATPKIPFTAQSMVALGGSVNKTVEADCLRFEVVGDKLLVRWQDGLIVGDRHRLRTGIDYVLGERQARLRKDKGRY